MVWSVPAKGRLRLPGDLVVVSPPQEGVAVLTRVYPNNTLAESHSITEPIFVVWLGQQSFDLSVDWEDLNVVLWQSIPHAVLRGNVNDVNT